MSSGHAPRVSVLIPAYNAERTLAETIESVLAQTYADFEIVVVDDGSTDGTRGLVEVFAAAQPPGRVRCITQRNGGVSSSRNTAVENARGELVAWIDADDLWRPDKLAKCVAMFDARPEIGLVHTNVERIDDAGNSLGVAHRSGRGRSGRIQRELILRNVHVATSSAMVRRGLFARTGGFDLALTRIGVEDRDMWIRIAGETAVGYLPDPLTLYRVAPGGFSRNIERMNSGRRYVIEKHCPRGRDWLLRARAYSRYHAEVADYHRQAGACGTALRHYAWALVLDPTNRATYAGVAHLVGGARRDRVVAG
jgi:glycosyltransferase involved in cell wall biosynthesis